MPLSVVIGGQYGSEGKGKVALWIARTLKAAAVVRVGGPNSGHTGVDSKGKTWIFRQLPAAALAEQVLVILPAGSLIDPEILRFEVESLGLSKDRLIIDSQASVVEKRHRNVEKIGGLIERIGSTGSGTGATLSDRIARSDGHRLAKDHPYLKNFIVDSTSDVIRSLLDRYERVVIEGTQGFGLSLWHSGVYPFSTSRDTTAAAFVSEAGLAPHDVDDVVMVIRTFPIRVGGNSGPLKNEISWGTLAFEAGLPPDHVELTSATKKVRRVARFDPDIVRKAIITNKPHRIVLNHMDYIERDKSNFSVGEYAQKKFIFGIEFEIAQKIDLIGLSADILVTRRDFLEMKADRYGN